MKFKNLPNIKEIAKRYNSKDYDYPSIRQSEIENILALIVECPFDIQDEDYDSDMFLDYIMDELRKIK